METSVKMMALAFRVRDLLRPRERILAEAGIRPGDAVLDFGCGPGSYLGPAARLTGPGGTLYALDANAGAVDWASKRAAREGLKNVDFIHGDVTRMFGDGCLDVILLYDVLHHLADPQSLLADFCRILKPNGRLSVSDHHMNRSAIRNLVSGPFSHTATGRYTLSFEPRESLDGEA